MATWEDLRTYIHGNLKVDDETPDGSILRLLVNFPEQERSQVVFVSHHRLMDGLEDWAVIESPVGNLGQVDLNTAVRVVGRMVCGGLGTVAEQYVTMRHAIPLSNLDINEFERPFRLVVSSADDLEMALTGRDLF